MGKLGDAWGDSMKMSIAVLAILSAALLALPVTGNSQTPPKSTALTISGHSGEAPLLQINGKSYVEVEALARLTQGTLSFNVNRTILTIPPATEGAKASAPQPKLGFSRAFIQAGIEELSLIREWQIAVVNAVQSNTPLTEDWVNDHRSLTEKNLALASASASTDDDRSGYPLLAAEFSNMQKLSDRYLTMRSQIKFISPDLFDSDPLEKQILSCARGFASMTASHEFQDEPACH
jgi:hypothetical protein